MKHDFNTILGHFVWALIFCDVPLCLTNEDDSAVPQQQQWALWMPIVIGPMCKWVHT